MERNHQRRPPDVNEALSSMLWTPYERTPSDSSSDDDEKLNAKLKKSKSSFEYSFPTKTQYVPSCRKIQRYDNFRFSYPYYGPIHNTVQKCITELPSYESLYHNVTPVLSSITGLHGRLVHSFTDNFITPSRPSSTTAVCDTAAATILRITNSMSGFSNNFTDNDHDDDDYNQSPTNNNNMVMASAILCEDHSGLATSSRPFEQSAADTKDSTQTIESSSRSSDPDALQCDNNGDLLLAKNNNVSERQHPRKQHQQQQQPSQQQRQSDLATAQTITERQDVAFVVRDLPGEVRVSKPGDDDHQSCSALYGESGPEYRSCAAIVDSPPSPATAIALPATATTTTAAAAIANPSCTGEKPETKCARAAQADLACSAPKLSTPRLVEDVGSAIVVPESVVFNASDLRDYDFVSSESVEGDDFLNLDARNRLLAMRLNIPAASPSIILEPSAKGAVAASTNNNIAAISTTSLFLPLSNNGSSSTGIGRRSANANANASATTTASTGAIVQAKPSLTIQVNQSNDSPGSRGASSSSEELANKSHDYVVNKSTGISVVNCYSGSSVPNSSVSSVPNVVATTTTASASTTTTTGNIGRCNSFNVTNSLSDCDNSASVQITGLPSPAAPPQQPQNQHRPLARTFTSTECQTDDLHLDRNDLNLSSQSIAAGISQSQTEALISREQRRRERRERRQQGRNRHPHILPHMRPAPSVIRPTMLPDILHSHFPPPYTALSSLTNPPPPPPSSLITPVISTVPIAAATVNDGRFTIPLPVIRRSPSERSGKGCCGQWFAGPPLRALIAVVALGGVACALGGAALGVTGMGGPPTSHLTAALLMIGVGVILVTVSGAAWRMTAPGGPPCLGLGSTVDLARCGRRPCNSRGAPHGLLYPEFQHRQPPPSYQASMQEYRLRLLLLDRDRQNGVVRGGSPPPTYRSHAGSLLRAPLSTTGRNGCGPGSEYSLPPSYRSRNVNMNTNPNTARSSAGVLADESMESLGSNTINNNPIVSSSLSSTNGIMPQYHTTATRALVEQLQSTTMSTIQEPSTIAINSDDCVTTATTTPSIRTTKDSVHTIAIEAGAATPIEHTQNLSQNINEKFNPRVTNSNNKINRISSCSSSGSISCIKGSSSSSPLVTSTNTTSLSSTTTNSSINEQSKTFPGNNRKELVTIVTISSGQGPESTPSEMEILAHL